MVNNADIPSPTPSPEVSTVDLSMGPSQESKKHRDKKTMWIVIASINGMTVLVIITICTVLSVRARNFKEYANTIDTAKVRISCVKWQRWREKQALKKYYIEAENELKNFPDLSLDNVNDETPQIIKRDTKV